jgi:hypothetical protein
MNVLSKSVLVGSGVALGALLMSNMFASNNNPELQAAIQAQDYSQLSAEMQERISEDKFEKIAQKHLTHDQVKEAVDAGDYDLLPIEAQERMDEEKFQEQVDRLTTQKAVKAAIDAGDYDAFVEVAEGKILDKITSEEDFNELLAQKVDRDAMRQTVETAVANNDFDAFSDAVDAFDGNGDKPEQTDEQKQQKFDRLVEYYDENGELPHMKKKR